MVLRHGILSGIGVAMLFLLTVSIPITDCLRYLDDNITMIESNEKGESEKEKEAKDIETEDSKICVRDGAAQSGILQSLRAHDRLSLLSGVYKEILDPPPEIV